MKLYIIYLLIAIFIFSSLIFANGLCQEQECISTDPPNPPNYPQGNDIEITGITTYSGGQFVDQCIVSSVDETVVGYSGTLNESYCSEPNSFAYELINCVDYGQNNYGKNYICFDGACMETVCYSTDSPNIPEYPQGNNTFEPGITTSRNFPGQSYPDECQEDGVTLKEYYCLEPDSVRYKFIDCNSECIDKKGAISGRCAETDEVGYCKCRMNVCYSGDPPECDINNPESYPCGYDPFLNGTTVNDSGNPHVDECKDESGESSDRFLTEYYCPTEPETGSWNYEHKIIDCNDWYNTICNDNKCYCAGNVNLDDIVNMFDIGPVARCFGCTDDQDCWTNDTRCASYNIVSVLSKDHQVIDMRDLGLVARAFGNECGCKEGTYNSSTGECE